MSADPASTIFEELKALASALADAHTQQGVRSRGRGAAVPNLYQHLTDEDLIKRMLARGRLIAFNELLSKGPTRPTLSRWSSISRRSPAAGANGRRRLGMGRGLSHL